MLITIMLSIIMLSVIILSVFMLGVAMVNVIMLINVFLNVMEPLEQLRPNLFNDIGHLR